MDIDDILSRLPGKDCGLCGYRTCRELAEIVLAEPEGIKRCIYIEPKFCNQP